MSTPCPPALRDQNRAEASGPCHPCPEASKGIQVALEKWRKAEERQAATKAACCHKVRRLPWRIALLQPSPPYSTSGVQGVRAPEYHLPAMTSSLHPFPTTPAIPQNLPTIRNFCQHQCLIVALLKFGKAVAGVRKGKEKKFWLKLCWQAATQLRLCGFCSSFSGSPVNFKIHS